MELIVLTREQYQADLKECAINAVDEYQKRLSLQADEDALTEVRVDHLANEFDKGVKTLQAKAKKLGIVVRSYPMTIRKRDIMKLLTT